MEDTKGIESYIASLEKLCEWVGNKLEIAILKSAIDTTCIPLIKYYTYKLNDFSDLNNENMFRIIIDYFKSEFINLEYIKKWCENGFCPNKYLSLFINTNKFDIAKYFINECGVSTSTIIEYTQCTNSYFTDSILDGGIDNALLTSEGIDFLEEYEINSEEITKCMLDRYIYKFRERAKVLRSKGVSFDKVIDEMIL